MTEPVFTHHARQRFAKRFPGQDIELEFKLAQYRLTRNDFKQLRATCPAHVRVSNRADAEYFFVKTRDGITFVVSRPMVVVTVFRLKRYSRTH